MDVLAFLDRIDLAVAGKYGKGKKSEFYAAADISPTSIHRWKTGIALPRIETVWRMAELLDVSPEWLLFGTGDSGAGKTDRDTRSAELLAVFRRLSGDDQQRVLLFAQNLVVIQGH